MKTIDIQKGRVAFVDDEDFSDIAQFHWYVDGAGYVTRAFHDFKLGKQRYELMHRRIQKLRHGDGKEVDHINGNKFDNRKENLRVCTRRENQRNVGLTSNNKTGFKGVSSAGRLGKWKAQIHIDKKQIYLGTFDSIEAASQAYRDAAIEHFGDFANLGSPA